MHRVVVVPLAAPYEAVRLEDPDDLPGNLVLVEIAAVGIWLRPPPIVGMRAGNIDRDPQPVRALAIRARDEATVIGALGRSQIGQKTLRQLVELVRDVPQRQRRSIDFGEFEGFAELPR